MKRVFAAIKFEPFDVLTEFHYRLKNTFKVEKIKWVELYNLHLTLKFFGETEEEIISAINHSFKNIAQKHKPFSIHFNKAGIFGSKYKPRVIWLGIEDNPELFDLARDIMSQMDQLGFISDRQNFVPHLTLGRIKFVVNKSLFFERFQQFKSFNSDPIKVEEFHLIESKLHSSGPEYDVLHSYLLE